MTNNWHVPYLFFSLLLIMDVEPAEAKIFRNDYLEFSISDQWNCQRQNIDWICRPQGRFSPQALIIVTAKQTGPEDNLQNFLAYLSKPKALAARGQAKITSQVIHAKERDIFGLKWAEGLHLNSEVENFYTLYLATVKQGLSVLVSLSVEKPIATQFNKDFSLVIQSLKIIANEEFLAQLDQSSGAPVSPIGIPNQVNSESTDDITGGPSNLLFGFPKEWIYGLFFIFILAMGGLVWTSIAPSKKKKRSKKK